MKRKTPDSVCAEAHDKIKFKVAPLPDDPTYVLIEGDKEAFKFLARLLDAQAEARTIAASRSARRVQGVRDLHEVHRSESIYTACLA